MPYSPLGTPPVRVVFMHRDRGGTDAASFVGHPVTLGRADDRPLYDFVWTVLSAGASSGPYLGEMRSVHGRPSIKMVGIGLSVSILPKSFHRFAFLGRVGV